MATYRQDLTQDIQPAMANIGTLAKADEAMAMAAKYRAGAVDTLARGAGAAIEAGVNVQQKMAIRDVDKEAEQLRESFFETNMAAERASEKFGTLATERTMFDKLNMGPNMAEGQAAIDKKLAGYDSELERLKLAAEGGMRNDTYVNRVSALTKKAIAQYPALADQIRQRVGAVTGLEGADAWADMQYVRSRFTAQKEAKGPTEAEMAGATIKRIAPYGTFGDEVTLFKLYNTDRAAFDQRVRAASEWEASKTQTDAVKNTVSGLQGQSDLQADTARAGFTAIFAGRLQTNVLSSTIKDTEEVYGKVLALQAKGENISINPVAFDVQIKTHAAQMLTYIDSAKREAYASVDNYLANNPNVTDAKRKELYADVDRASEVMKARYADDKGVGLAAMSNIFRTYRDKSLQEKTQLVDLAIKQQSAMQNNPMVMAYWAGGEARENLRRTQPYFFEFMVGQEQELTSSLVGVRNDIKGATDLGNVQRVLTQAQQAPVAVPVDPVASPTVTKASHQVLHASAKTVLEKASKSGVVAPADVNTIAAAFATNTETGANSLILAREWKQLNGKLNALPEVDLNTIKGSVSNSVKTTVTSIQSLKQGIEAKYNVTLQLGVNDAGEIGVIAPPTTLGNRPLAGGTGFNPAAAKEFTQKAKPLLSNIVYGRSMLTGEQPKAVGTEFATVINSNQAYKGFYQQEAQPVAAPAAPVTPAQPATPAPATTETSSLDESVKAQLKKMKDSDPDLNVDYIYNSFLRATPEQKKALEAKFRTNSVRMADLNAK
jgi:hypothetical protein